MKGSLRVFRIAGIDIGIHYSWILIFVLVATSLALFFGQVSLDRPIGTAVQWIAGALAALLLFASVLVHELAHSLVARARGIPVRSITLFIFGGVSNLEEEAERPGSEFAMAIVGPATSFVLALIFLGLYRIAEAGSVANPIVLLSQRYTGILSATLHYMAFINGTLAIFNMIPGFPLDGGRVLRSIIWAATGNLIRATNIAATIGRLFGWGLIAYGVYSVFGRDIVGGIWIGIIGWFLSNAADTSRAEVTLRERLSGVKVRDAMVQYRESISPSATVAELVSGIMSQRFGRAVPVCEGDRTVGIVTISDVKSVRQEEWTITPVERVMTKGPLYSVRPEDDLSQAMKLIAQHDLNQVLVMNDGQCAGLLSRAEIIRYLQLTQELRIKGKRSQ